MTIVMAMMVRMVMRVMMVSMMTMTPLVLMVATCQGGCWASGVCLRPASVRPRHHGGEVDLVPATMGGRCKPPWEGGGSGPCHYGGRVGKPTTMGGRGGRV